jgi:hypothetical protein
MLAAAPLLGVAGSREVAVTSTLIGKQAVVIGAGMGGLAAAGALSDCFEQVFVLERDTLPSEPAYRVGTPQARHVHALLLRASALSASCSRGSSRIWRGLILGLGGWLLRLTSGIPWPWPLSTLRSGLDGRAASTDQGGGKRR